MTLYVDGGERSKRAIEALQAAGIGFTLLFRGAESEWSRLPVLATRSELFVGVLNILRAIDHGQFTKR